ncbi:hypothetical protein IL992_04275 [Microbispora sp. NEAU-D428]|uniref:hypothetical protein n=1 Tax=Microbispora sitophila TaxID=2771537 RepID=UPI0018675FDE|nr:hypothetical protein [Microbispora sitophila]MBE3008402.1 hypothetical protein [Microbispora sitophila]
MVVAVVVSVVSPAAATAAAVTAAATAAAVTAAATAAAVTATAAAALVVGARREIGTVSRARRQHRGEGVVRCGGL